MIPGEIITRPGDIELNAGRKTVTLTVANTGDLSQLESHHVHHGHHAHGTYNSQGQAVAPTAASSSQADASSGVQQLFTNIVHEVQQAIGA